LSNPKRNETYCVTIHGEPASKANSRRSVLIGGKPRFIKSKKALNYAKDFDKQCPVKNPLLKGDVFVACKVWYRTRRPDLDVSLILDLLESKFYQNDRQVRRMFLDHGIDRDDPRAEIVVLPIEQSFTWETLWESNAS
jgi:Holliday junction resolvase RusA-like endonuclease